MAPKKRANRSRSPRRVAGTHDRPVVTELRHIKTMMIYPMEAI
jgi:hypothetical protein